MYEAADRVTRVFPLMTLLPSSFPFRMLAEPVSPSASMSVSLSPSPSPLTSSLAATAEPRPNLTAAECGGPITEEDEEHYKEIW